MANVRPHLVRGEKQLAALAAAARQEIVDVLEQLGTVSVAERKRRWKKQKPRRSGREFERRRNSGITRSFGRMSGTRETLDPRRRYADHVQ
jgi:hypothetical protein